MSDIFDQLGDIPGLREFQAEPPTLESVPAAQRAREFLAERAGPAWLSARIVSYPGPGGTIHIASAPMAFLRNGAVLFVVVESPTGEMSLPSPLENDGESMQFVRSAGAPDDDAASRSEAYRAEHECLDQILPALAAASKIIAAAEDVKPRRKKRILGQLHHAASHLLAHLESLM